MRGQSKPGYRKIQFCGEQARKDGIGHFWMDTCCINKDSHTELSKAITSMYRWYHKAVKCYVYLPDVSIHEYDSEGGIDGSPRNGWKATFRTCKWFTRGWTLQELLAPRVVAFFSVEHEILGDKVSLASEIHEITKIPVSALHGTPLSQFPINERLGWAQGRQTKEQEDQAYCLLGICEVFMPFIYGEGDNALRRLRKEINDQYGRDVDSHLGSGPGIRSLGLRLASAPLIQADDFVGRIAEINSIQNILHPDCVPLEQRRVVLGGMGGMGKTQVAIAYARQHAHIYKSVLWLNASTEMTLFSSLRSVAEAMAAVEELKKPDENQILVRVHQWLSHPQNLHWLLIFDNYDDPDQFDIHRFYSDTSYGSIIITTRLPDLVTGPQVRLQSLIEIDDSLNILQARSGRPHVMDDAGARRLAERLDGLPLALVTAGAYLRQSVFTFQQYLDVYEQRWRFDPRRPLRLHEYQDRTLHTTWNLSFIRLVKDDPDAAQMLKLLAYFDNQEVWFELLHAGLSNDSPSWLQSCLAEQSSFENIMRTLVEYSLMEVHYTTRSYSMHSCVHDWTLGELNREIDPQLYWYSFDCVAASINRDDWDMLGQVKYARISRHGTRLTHHRFKACDESPNRLLERYEGVKLIARMLCDQTQHSAAEQIYLRTLAGQEKVLGRDHTSTLDTVSHLGILYKIQGKLDNAEQMYLRALTGRESILGRNHTSTLDTVTNIGTLYKHQGKLDEVEKMYLRALTGYEIAVGRDHIWTLETVNNLGILYKTLGKLDMAEQMLLRALNGKEDILGDDHPSTLKTVNNLGSFYSCCQDKLDEAEQMYLRALTGKEKTLGAKASPNNKSA